jgi:hypothetical protein
MKWLSAMLRALVIATVAGLLLACGNGSDSATSETTPRPVDSDTPFPEEEEFVGEIGPFDFGPGSYKQFCNVKQGSDLGVVDDGEQIEASELFVPEFAEDLLSALGCEDGTVFCISYAIQFPTTDVEARKCYFDGRAGAGIGAPRSRIVETEIEGRPAVEELPRSDVLTGGEAIVSVIERFPEPGIPGILVSVSAWNDIESAEAVAESLLSADRAQ